jgi:threonylcarbamoyladenosine tRNA methylthiotransferase MtaB
MKIFLDTVGCRLNQSEIETFARQFRAAGHTLVASVEQADRVVINTCSVTAAAAADSRSKVRQAARAGNRDIVVTGCWATLDPAAAAELPGVSRVVANTEKDLLVPQLLGVPQEIFELEPLARAAVPGARLRTRAFLKVQDGCDNRCTFCVTTLARGAGRSRTLQEVMREVGSAVLGGVQEAVFTGVHLGSWGADLNPRLGLADLVREILASTDIPRLRLSSLEPWDLTPEFFRLWDDPRLCRHLHLPLQSGSAATLRRMARKTTPESFAELVAEARRHSPDMAVTTDVIVGFPGETAAEFEQSLDFVRRQAFAGGHVFSYSPRPGTAAACMPDQVPHAVRKERNARVRSVFANSGRRYQERFLGSTVEVLWESADALGPQEWSLSGLTDNYLRVNARAPRRFWNQITPVRLVGSEGKGLVGDFVDPRLAGRPAPPP